LKALKIRFQENPYSSALFFMSVIASWYLAWSPGHKKG